MINMGLEARTQSRAWVTGQGTGEGKKVQHERATSAELKEGPEEPAVRMDVQEEVRPAQEAASRETLRRT